MFQFAQGVLAQGGGGPGGQAGGQAGAGFGFGFNAGAGGGADGGAGAGGAGRKWFNILINQFWWLRFWNKHDINIK